MARVPGIATQLSRVFEIDVEDISLAIMKACAIMDIETISVDTNWTKNFLLPGELSENDQIESLLLYAGASISSDFSH